MPTAGSQLANVWPAARSAPSRPRRSPARWQHSLLSSATSIERGPRVLLESAQVHDAHGLTVLGRRLLVIAPDQADAHEAGVLEAEERRARDCCTLVMHRRGNGITKGTLLLPDAQAAMLRQALEAICSPRRWALGDSTPPTAVCTGCASPPGVDDNAPVLEELNSTSGPDIADATATPGGAGLDPAGFRCTDAQPTSPAAGEAVARAATVRTGRSGPTDEMQTAWARLSHPQRMGLALATLVEHLPSDALPQTGATVTVALDYKHLVTGLGAPPCPPARSCQPARRDDSPALRVCCLWCSTVAHCRWISAAAVGCSAQLSALPWRPVIAVASSALVTVRLPGARPTTAPLGRGTAPPT